MYEVRAEARTFKMIMQKIRPGSNPVSNPVTLKNAPPSDERRQDAGLLVPQQSSSSNKINVLYVPASGEVEIREIANDFTSLLELAGDGFLDAVRIADEIFMFCDETARDRSGKSNFTIRGHHVFGDAFFVRRNGNRLISMTADDVGRVASISKTKYE